MQRDKKFADARAVMKRIGGRLVRERQLALLEGRSEGDIEKVREYGKDLLSLLVKANMTDTEGSSMSDEDVQDRELIYPLSISFSSTHVLVMQLSPTSPYRNRHVYCCRSRDEQLRNRLVPSLFI